MDQDILRLFVHDHQLTFSQIARKLGVRTNKVSYHLKSLVNQGLLVKSDNSYALSHSFEPTIPYLSVDSAVLPVVLIGIGDSRQCFLVKRVKRPFKGLFGLPGGRVRVAESIAGAVARIMREKHGITASLSSVNSVSLEHVYRNGSIAHSFLLIFVSAKTGDEVLYKKVAGNKSVIIKSDYQLIKNDFDKEVSLREIRH